MLGRQFENYHHNATTPDDVTHPELGKLEVLVGVNEFPTRDQSLQEFLV